MVAGVCVQLGYSPTLGPLNETAFSYEGQAGPTYSSHAVGASVRWCPQFTEMFTLELGAGGTARFWSVNNDNLSTASDDPITGSVDVQIRPIFYPHKNVRLGGTLDIGLDILSGIWDIGAPQRFEFETTDERLVWRFRPGLLLGTNFTLTGDLEGLIDLLYQYHLPMNDVTLPGRTSGDPSYNLEVPGFHSLSVFAGVKF